MNFQDASNLRIPEGYVRTIHDKNSRLLWGSVGYDVSFDGNATQTTYSGKNKVNIPQTVEMVYQQAIQEYAVDLTGQYTISGFIYAQNNTAAGSAGCVGLNVDGTWQYIIIPQSALTAKTAVQKTVNGHITGIRLTSYGTQTGSKNVYTDMMLESGSTKTDYEPFVGGIPAPNPSYPQPISVVTGENVVKVVGKNLIDEDAMFDYLESNGFAVEDVTFDGREAFKYYKNGAGGINIAYPVQAPSGQVTVSFKYATDSGSDFYIRFLYSDGSGSDIKRGDATTWTDVTATSTAGKTVTGVRFMNYGGSVTKIYIAKDSFQLELGSTATSYQAYTGQDYTISLGELELAKIPGTDYRDKILYDTATSKWYVEKNVGKVVFDGSDDERWWLQTGTTKEMRAHISGTFVGAPLMSDYFHDSSSSSELGAMRIYFAGYIRAISNQTSANDFKTWLSTHNTTVYYALATPTTTEITDATLIAQLEAVYDWVRRHGYNASVTGDLPIIINRTALPTV